MMARAAKKSLLIALGMALGALLALALPAATMAQGCALCYQSAAASGPRMIHALRSGIIFLMFPPALITVGIAYMTYRRRNLHDED
jgi:hypothetical protein